VSPKSLVNLLEALDAAKQDFSAKGRHNLQAALSKLSRIKIDDPDLLIRYHELLLFLRAYPQTPPLLKLTEAQLKVFAHRVYALGKAEVDLALFEDPEISGIAGTSVTDAFGYYIVRWLVREQRGRVQLDEDWVDDESRLGATLSRFLPLLAEDSLVEANIPYRKWLDLGSSENPLPWLIKRFESLPKTRAEQAELYDSLKLYVRWHPDYRASRTGMKLPVKKIFYHQEALLRRKDVSLVTELRKSPLPFLNLATIEGRGILDLARETSTLRYRELYGFTHGDERRVLKFSPGRGVDIFVVGLPPEKRLPLRAYHAAMIFKNGIPIGYFEGLSLFERMESGFNLYYTFRDGETAWLYAQLLRIFKQLLGVTTFTLDPYQIGFENEEGIKSGAFWFYRKLGFRSTRKELVELTDKEERKLAGRTDYRTSASTLRKLATGYMIFESSPREVGAWDNFQVRNLGFAVQRRMARDFQSDPQKLRKKSVAEVAGFPGLQLTNWTSTEQAALEDLSLLLALIPGLDKWTTNEKQLLEKIIRAKAGRNESAFLRTMQKHQRLRREIIRLGS
jgi:hypothetical protein